MKLKRLVVIVLMEIYACRYSEQRENSELQKIMEEGSSRKSNLDVELRFLSPYDIDEVRLLCEESFPIEYPLKW